ncbi:MAG TPA: UDP-N-acetylmuramate dehydrogenase [Rhizobiales bacterium]|nr:UDP-N-acetylmuramate dehydrogenase [Hyphomicrobiales bacterium]
MPVVRGRLEAEVPLAPLSWLRVGGAAQVLFTPADEDDLAAFLKGLPSDVPLTMLGLASNTLIRDGGVPGVVIRLGRGFGKICVEEECRIRAGAAVPDRNLAQAAARAGIAGFSFYRGIPGCVGGALRMNAGAHGGETGDLLLEVRALDRQGQRLNLQLADMKYAYRHCGAPQDLIFTEALFQGRPGDQQELVAEMAKVMDVREASQPVRERTGGSTFKNPPGLSAWKLIDAAGCRNLRVGGAHMSEKHCNFLINDGDATASDIEQLGELVRRRVKAESGIELNWEVRRIGVPKT